MSDDPQLEIVVQDNGDNDQLELWMAEEVSDSRVVYQRDPIPIDVVQNFTAGAEASSGKYVCFIGDDDGVLPRLIDAVRWADLMGYDALVPTKSAHYWWPDVRHRYYGDAFSGALDIEEFTGAATIVDPNVELMKCARSGGSGFFLLPKVYHGAVRMDCLNRVKQGTGSYFPGPSPDLAGAVALASYVDSVCVLDLPLVLSGTAALSTGGLGASKKHEGRLESQPHLPAHSIANWSLLVPRFFSGATIWGEDVVAALGATQRNDVLKEFGVAQLHARCLAMNPRHASTTLRNLIPALKANQQLAATGLLRFMFAYVAVWAIRVKLHLAGALRRLLHAEDASAARPQNIAEAVDLLARHVDETGCYAEVLEIP